MNSMSVAQRPSFDRTAGAAHHVVDTLADQALTGVGKVSDSLHVAVNQAADAVSNAADWAAHVSGTNAERRESSWPIPRSRPSRRVRLSRWAAPSPSDSSSAVWRADDPPRRRKRRWRDNASVANGDDRGRWVLSRR